MPAIKKLYADYKDKGLVVLGVDDKENVEVVRGFARKNNLGYPIAADAKGEVFEHYGVRAIPTTVIYDRKGRIVTQIVGSRTEQQFVNLLRKAGLR